LNEYLSQAHNGDGTLKDIPQAKVTNLSSDLTTIQNTLSDKADTSALAAKLNTADLDTQTAAKINDNASATAGALSTTMGEQLETPGTPARDAADAAFAARPLLPPNISAHRLWPRLTVLQSFAAGHGWFVSGTIANANDTSDKVLSDRCLSLTTDGAGGFSSYFKGAVTLNLSAKGLVLWLKSTDATRLQFLSVDVANESGMTNKARASIPTVGLSGKSPLYEGQWVPLFIPAAQFVTSGGSPNLAAITYIQIIAADFGGGHPTTLKLGGVSTYTEGVAKFPNGVVMFSFDDSYATAWTTAVPYLAKYGFPGTLYPIVGNIGNVGRLTLDQVKAMQVAYGWEIGAHCMTQAQHVSMVGGDPTAIDQMLTDLRQWQADNGFVGSSFAYPIGPFDEQATTLVRKHFAYGRTNDGFPCSPYLDKPWTAPAVALGSSVSLAQAKAFVDRIVANKSAVNFVLHDLNSSGGANDWTVADFQALVDYVAASTASVVTPTELLAAQ